MKGGHFKMDLHEEITKKAYEIYEQNGKVPDHDLDNWFAAKKIVEENRENEKDGEDTEARAWGRGMRRHGMKEGMHHGKNC